MRLLGHAALLQSLSCTAASLENHHSNVVDLSDEWNIDKGAKRYNFFPQSYYWISWKFLFGMCRQPIGRLRLAGRSAYFLSFFLISKFFRSLQFACHVIANSAGGPIYFSPRNVDSLGRTKKNEKKNDWMNKNNPVDRSIPPFFWFVPVFIILFFYFFPTHYVGYSNILLYVR